MLMTSCRLRQFSSNNTQDLYSKLDHEANYSSDDHEFNQIVELDQLIDGFDDTIVMGDILKFMGLLKDLREVVEMDSKKITAVIEQVVTPSIFDITNGDHFIEMLESAAGIIPIANQNFWGSAINYIIINFQNFDLKQIADSLKIFGDLGFGKLEIQVQCLPDHLQAR